MSIANKRALVVRASMLSLNAPRHAQLRVIAQRACSWLAFEHRDRATPSAAVIASVIGESLEDVIAYVRMLKKTNKKLSAYSVKLYARQYHGRCDQQAKRCHDGVFSKAFANVHANGIGKARSKPCAQPFKQFRSALGLSTQRMRILAQGRAQQANK